MGDTTHLLPPQLKYKVVLLGNTGVGKTSIMTRFSDNEFCASWAPTIGVDFRVEHLTSRLSLDRDVQLKIWDNAGHHKFRGIVAGYMKNAEAAVLVFDVTNPTSFKDLAMWVEDLKRHGPKDVRFRLLVGNKIDKVGLGRRAVSEASARDFAQEHGFRYVETSAATGEGVEEVFLQVAKTLLRWEPEQPLDCRGTSVLRTADGAARGPGPCFCLPSGFKWAGALLMPPLGL